MPSRSWRADPCVDLLVEGGLAVLTVRGCLDEHLGAALVRRTADAAGTAARVEIDLRSLTSFTPKGADALTACRGVCGELAEGLHYRTGRGPGRDALLAAYSEQ